MYLDDAIGSDTSSIIHVATLGSSRAYGYNIFKLSPNKKRIGAARVDFLRHVISHDGVGPNKDKIVALTRIPMPMDIK